MIHAKISSSDDNGIGSNAPHHVPCKSTTIVAVRFWTEQLKGAMLTRYGPVGNNVNMVRQLLHHTKQVVRNKDGIESVMYKFI